MRRGGLSYWGEPVTLIEYEGSYIEPLLIFRDQFKSCTHTVLTPILFIKEVPKPRSKAPRQEAGRGA